MGILEKIKDIEEEMKRTQKNKATEYHLGLLKAKLAKYRAELLTPSSGPGGEGKGFDVARSGDGRVAMIGFPSVGKSSLLNSLTDTESEAAGYEFTTLTCIPGNILYNGCKIQLLDLPGIIEGAAHGRGRGREVIAVAKSSDLILMVLDAAKEGVNNHRAILERELETVGLRLNKKPPNITFRKKRDGGLKITQAVPQTQMGEDPEKTIRQILATYKIHHAELLFREDVTTDEFIDVIMENRKYIKCLYVYNKIDQITIEEVDELARQPHSTVISVHMNLNQAELLSMMWEFMGLVRVYTKKKGRSPDFSDPIVLSSERKGITVEAAVMDISKDMLKIFSFAYVWGRSTKHNPQNCGIQHQLMDEDVLQVVTKTVHQQRRDKNYVNVVQAHADAWKKKKKAALKT